MSGRATTVWHAPRIWRSKGWKIAVFERNAAIGGAVQTGEFTLPGFRHDFGAMNLSLFAGSAFHRKYANELKTHGLEFAPVADCFASAFPDGRWFGVSTDLEKTAARIAAFSAADAETWRRLVAAFPGEAEHLFRLLGSPMSMRALAGTAWNAWRKKGVGGALDMARLLLASPRAWLDENFESAHVKATLAAWGMHLDFAPDIAGGAVFPYLESMANQSFGMVLGKGGADTMIRALEKMLVGRRRQDLHQCRGRRDHHVRRQGDRRAARLRRDPYGDESGDRRRRAGALPGKLLPRGSGDAAFDRAMKKFRHAPGTMMIHLALDDLPDWRAGAELRQFAYVHLAPSLDAMARTYQQAMAGLLAGRAGAGGRPADRDRSVARAGRQARALGAGAHAARRHRRRCGRRDRAGPLGRGQGALRRPRPRHHRELCARPRDKRSSAARCSRRSISSARTRTWSAATRSAAATISSQNFLFRPARGFARWNTPVEKLHLVGAATWPGAGTGAGSGFLLAQQLGGR